MTAPRPQKHTRRYPWTRWFRRGVFTLVRGLDFEYRCYVMVQMVRRAAKKHGLRVSVKVAEDESAIKVAVWSETLEARRRREAEEQFAKEGG